MTPTAVFPFPDPPRAAVFLLAALLVPPAVCKLGERYLLLYMALEAAPGLYAATSIDGLRWTMLNGGKPVLRPGAADDFDGRLVGHPCLLTVGDRLCCWYTGYCSESGGAKGRKLRVGLAEGPLALEPSP